MDQVHFESRERKIRFERIVAKCLIKIYFNNITKTSYYVKIDKHEKKTKKKNKKNKTKQKNKKRM